MKALFGCCRGYEVLLTTLNKWSWKDASVAVIIISTTGNGDPPENADKGWRALKRRTQPKDLLKHITYAVLVRHRPPCN